MSDELSWFRKVSFAEGWSFILLLGVAMPLKYIWGQPMAVSIVGAIHGGLFLLYGVLAIIVAQKEGWTKKFLLTALIASVLPFGPFIFDRKLSTSS